MSLAALVRRMAAAGASPEAIAIAPEAVEAAQAVDAERRRKRAAQKAKERRERRTPGNGGDDPSPDGGATVARHDDDSRPTQSLDKENPPHPLKKTQPLPSLRSGRAREEKPTPRQILLECPGLSPDSADAVLAHRKAMRRPLTGRAAQLLAKGFLATADPNAAADMMIERGWQGFKPEWFDNERRSNGQGNRQGKGSIVEAGRRLTERLVAAERDRDVQTERGFREGDDVVRLLPGGLGKRS